MTQNMNFSENRKLTLGLLLLAACIFLYFTYHSTQMEFLIPISVAFFAAGVYLIQSKFKFLKQNRQLLTFTIITALIFWIFFVEGWESFLYQYLDKSPYVGIILRMEAKFTTLTLNAFGSNMLEASHEYAGFGFFMAVIVLFWILSMKLISNSKRTQNLTLQDGTSRPPSSTEATHEETKHLEATSISSSSVTSTRQKQHPSSRSWRNSSHARSTTPFSHQKSSGRGRLNTTRS